MYNILVYLCALPRIHVFYGTPIPEDVAREHVSEMHMTEKTVTFLSARGGMGKSTVAAGVALAAAHNGMRVTLIDFDLSERSLDTLLGCEDQVVYDLGDLIAGRRDIMGVVLSLYGGLRFIPGAFCTDVNLDEAGLASLLRKVRDVTQADMVFIDTASTSDPVARLLSRLSETLVVVSTPDEIPLVSTASLAARLAEHGRRDARMLLNRVPLTDGAQDIRFAVDTACLPLVGLVPAAELRTQRASLTAPDEASSLTRAYSNIATRLAGGHAPLLTGVTDDRRTLLSI